MAQDQLFGDRYCHSLYVLQSEAQKDSLLSQHLSITVGKKKKRKKNNNNKKKKTANNKVLINQNQLLLFIYLFIYFLAMAETQNFHYLHIIRSLYSEAGKTAINIDFLGLVFTGE